MELMEGCPSCASESLEPEQPETSQAMTSIRVGRKMHWREQGLYSFIYWHRLWLHRYRHWSAAYHPISA